MIADFILKSCDGGDALIIIPPFGGIDRPSLGAHILQSTAKKHDYKVDVLYCNLLLARQIGVKLYEYICYAPSTGLIGERFFSSAAYNLNAVSLYPNKENTGCIRTSRDTQLEGFLEEYKKKSTLVCDWIDELTTQILKRSYPIIGCSTTFEQTSSSISLLNRIKRKNRSIITIIGGANCEDQMADGIATLSDSIDYIFSGESEISFVNFLNAIKNGRIPSSRVIYGELTKQLSDIPIVNYSDYYKQLGLLNISKEDLSEIWLPYESSRGCWWGEKHHCLFCGINGEGIKYREKDAEQVLYELTALIKEHPTNKVCMVDNIMPHTYFKSLLPKLASKNNKYHFFYEQKANLNIDQVLLLKKAGVNIIQPGIEAVSTPLLKMMQKGVTAKQNIALLRYARMADLYVNWNILHSFPHDIAKWYDDTIEVLHNVTHLNPPTGSYGLSIDRFSPYFDQSERYSLLNLRPIHSYYEVFPSTSDIGKIAYHFEADYPSASKDNEFILGAIEQEINFWRQAWLENVAPPVLHINNLNDDTYLLIDTRPTTPLDKRFVFTNRDRAIACLFGEGTISEVDWAVQEKYCIRQENEIIALPTTSVSTYKRLKAQRKNKDALENIPVKIHA